jgi:hypothetical protein
MNSVEFEDFQYSDTLTLLSLNNRINSDANYSLMNCTMDVVACCIVTSTYLGEPKRRLESLQDYV